MEWKDRIESDPNVLGGKPVIRGTRVSVEQVLQHLVDGWTVPDLLRSYPKIGKDDVIACLQYAEHSIKGQQ